MTQSAALCVARKMAGTHMLAGSEKFVHFVWSFLRSLEAGSVK